MVTRSKDTTCPLGSTGPQQEHGDPGSLSGESRFLRSPHTPLTIHSAVSSGHGAFTTQGTERQLLGANTLACCLLMLALPIRKHY